MHVWAVETKASILENVMGIFRVKDEVLAVLEQSLPEKLSLNEYQDMSVWWFWEDILPNPTAKPHTKVRDPHNTAEPASWHECRAQCTAAAEESGRVLWRLGCDWEPRSHESGFIFWFSAANWCRQTLTWTSLSTKCFKSLSQKAQWVGTSTAHAKLCHFWMLFVCYLIWAIVWPRQNLLLDRCHWVVRKTLVSNSYGAKKDLPKRWLDQKESTHTENHKIVW